MCISLMALLCAFQNDPTAAREAKVNVVFSQLLPNGKFDEAALQLQEMGMNDAYKYVNTHKNTDFSYFFFYQNFVTPSVKSAENAFFASKMAKDDTVSIDLEKKRAELGRLLFYDPILSANAKRTCSSCHKSQKAFTDHRIVSRGFLFSESLSKNAPTLLNATSQTRFFHEGQHKRLEDVFDAVITNPKEFNFSYAGILERLNGSEAYKTLFFKAFPTANTIKRAELDASLISFLKILRGYDSPFDSLLNVKNATPNTPEVLGFNLFMGKAKCGSCHLAPSFGGSLAPFSDGHETHEVNGKMIKTPSLRNVALTEPYMHDGRMAKIEDIFEEQFHKKYKTDLSENEREKVLIFLKSLNDKPHLEANEPDALPLILGFERRNVGGTY